MKHLLGFLAGSLMTTSAVVLAGGYGTVILGGILTVALLALSMWALGIPRVSRWLLALHNANSEPRRAATPGRRKNHTARATNVVSFQKPNDVLNPTQQQVVSALHNLGMPMKKAERIVLEASQGRPGINFDSLFRACLAPQKTASA